MPEEIRGATEWGEAKYLVANFFRRFCPAQLVSRAIDSPSFSRQLQVFFVRVGAWFCSSRKAVSERGNYQFRNSWLTSWSEFIFVTLSWNSENQSHWLATRSTSFYSPLLPLSRESVARNRKSWELLLLSTTWQTDRCMREGREDEGRDRCEVIELKWSSAGETSRRDQVLAELLGLCSNSFVLLPSFL